LSPDTLYISLPDFDPPCFAEFALQSAYYVLHFSKPKERFFYRNKIKQCKTIKKHCKTIQNNAIKYIKKTKQNKTNQVQKNMQQRFVTSIRCRTGSGSLSPLDIHNGTKQFGTTYKRYIRETSEQMAHWLIKQSQTPKNQKVDRPCYVSGERV